METPDEIVELISEDSICSRPAISESWFMISALSNPTELSVQHALTRNRASLHTTLQRLATGKKINSGKDGPAALISSEQLASKLKALQAETQALQRQDANANISDGYGSQISTLMGDLNALVVAGANQAGMSDAEIQANQMQVDSIVSNVRRFTNDTVTSLDGITMPDGGNAEVEALLTGASAAVAALASGGANSLTSGNLEAAQQAVQDAILDVVTARGKIGAYQKNTIGPAIASNQIAIENLTESKSKIADTDYAVELSNLSRLEVLTASNVQVLKIAQQQPKTILDLLSHTG